MNRNQEVQNIINSFKNINGTVYVLEAGCGSLSRFEFGSNFHITGIDISSKQLERNENVNEKILGDLQTYKLQVDQYDIIMCIDVLEHLSKPNQALNNLFGAIKRDGIAVLSSPDPLSVKGLVTKFTPHWFHVFIYRRIYKLPNAGKEDTAPFKTFLRFRMSKNAVIKRANSYGFKCELDHSTDALLSSNWVSNSFRNKSILLYSMLRFIVIFLKIITFNLIGESEYTLVLRNKKQ